MSELWLYTRNSYYDIDGFEWQTGINHAHLDQNDIVLEGLDMGLITIKIDYFILTFHMNQYTRFMQTVAKVLREMSFRFYY